MGSISHHIMPLVINSFGGGHTSTHPYIHLHRNNSKKPGARAGLPAACAWFKNTFGIQSAVKYSRIIPESEYMSILVTTRSDIRMQPRLSILKKHYSGHIIAS